MLSKIIINNFKQLESIQIPLKNSTILTGENNGGKTSALQALTLWSLGVKKWIEKYSPKNYNHKTLKKYPTIPINRLDITSIPLSKMNMLWLQQKTKNSRNKNIPIKLIAEGKNEKGNWQCGMEYLYANPEIAYCRPIVLNFKNNPDEQIIPQEAIDINVFLLPAMSGISLKEPLIQEGRINVLKGEGRTSEILRNLCYQLYSKTNKEEWEFVTEHIKNFFGIILNKPSFESYDGTIKMDYTYKKGKVKLDISSSGSSVQQTLLLLSSIYLCPKNSILLLDNPDLHLETSIQEKIYELIEKIAEKKEIQIISATHSKTLLNKVTQVESIDNCTKNLYYL